MEFIEHLSISLILGILVSLFLQVDFGTALFLIAVAVVSGTLIDLDHFLLARYLDGDWEKLLMALRNPLEMASDNEGLIREKWLPPFLVVKTHLVELSILLVFYLVIDHLLLLVSAISVSAHILCDVWADWRKGYLGDYLG
jgi:hypothetical protein